MGNFENIKMWAKKILQNTVFYPIAMGQYIRGLYFRKSLSLVPIDKIHNVLDAGCGVGSSAIKLAAMYPNWKVSGCDLDIDRVIKNDRQCSVYFFQTDLTALCKIEDYDFIYSIDVLDDISNYTKAISNLVTALRPGGYIWIHLPLHSGRVTIFNLRSIQEYTQIDLGNSHGSNLDEHILQKQLSSRIITLDSGYSFGWFGTLAWELGRIIDNNLFLRLLVTPLLKMLGHLDLKSKITNGNGYYLLGQKSLK